MNWDPFKVLLHGTVYKPFGTTCQPFETVCGPFGIACEHIYLHVGSRVQHVSQTDCM